MFASVHGTITYKDAERVLIDTHGIEWEVQTSSRSSDQVGAIGASGRMFTVLYHRDDQMRLYGFATPEERELFNQLLRVGGLGPRLAVRILSGIDGDALIRALEAEDLDTLTAIPGLGKKTAQKIMLALRGKIALERDAAAKPGTEQDLVGALIGMGFGQKETRDAVRTALEATDGDGRQRSPEEREREAFRRALTALGGDS